MCKEIDMGIEEYFLVYRSDDVYECSFCGARIHEDIIVSNGTGLYACPLHANHPMMQNDYYDY